VAHVIFGGGPFQLYSWHRLNRVPKERTGYRRFAIGWERQTSRCGELRQKRYVSLGVSHEAVVRLLVLRMSEVCSLVQKGTRCGPLLVRVGNGIDVCARRGTYH